MRQTAETVKQLHSPVVLEQMPNYERRIVNAYVQDNYPELLSTSEGIEPNRKIVISLKQF